MKMSETPKDSDFEDDAKDSKPRRSRETGRDYLAGSGSGESRSSAPRGRDNRGASRDSRGGSRDSRSDRSPRGRTFGDRDSRGPSRDSRGGSRDGRDSSRGGDRDSRDQRRSRGGDRDAQRGRSDSDGRGRNDNLDDSYYRQGPRNWGSLGRKGAASMHREDAGPRSDEDDDQTEIVQPTPSDKWIDEGPVQKRSSRGRSREMQESQPTARITLSGDEAIDLTDAQRRRFDARLNEAADAYVADRLGQAKDLLSSLVDRFPSSVEVRELFGLTFYGLGNWKLALRQLEAFQEMTHSYEQHHVIADCYRALGQHKKVVAVWDELKEASPSGEIVTEGRIVAAGSLADKGDIQAAIRLLQKGPTRPKRPKPYTFRLWYAIADLQERAGDMPGAREQFRHLADRSPEFGDVQDRLDALS